MTQIFGDFIDNLLDSQESLRLEFTPGSMPLKQRWQNNGLSANFMADYFAIFFTTSETRVEVTSAVSFVANELLENAMKFRDETSNYSIRLSLQLYEDRLVFIATNSVNPLTIENFQAFIQTLITCDPSELYISQLEKNAEDDTNTVSGLGLLTMVNDYLAHLGWKFDTVQKEPEVMIVSTMVQLMI
ncbi:slr1658 superfamily regulator [Nostoc sp. CALU 546]|uniref:slr1658 superfamily regulator n=1 Tax=Nostoc sp. CALU 546 TaxID=1867241 RepID=UPI003B67A936